EMMADLPIHFDDYTFIDLGSGKGATLLYASEYPFRRIVGVEFARELHDIARRNIVAYKSSTQRCRVIEAIHADAAEFQFPSGPLVIFANNPFGPAVWSRVFENLARVYAGSPERYLVHWNLEQHSGHPFLTMIRSGAGYRIYRFGPNVQSLPEHASPGLL